MNAIELEKLLRALCAGSGVIQWTKGKDLHEAWTTCDRADRLLWLAGRMAEKPGWPRRKQIVLAACACAETALKFVPAAEKRPKAAIETARAWARGSASIEDVRRARDAADAAYAAATAAACAATAAAYAACTAYAADAADAPAYAADAAAAAAAAAADAAAADAYAAAAAADAADAAADAADAARTEARAACFVIIRRELPEPLAAQEAASKAARA